MHESDATKVYAILSSFLYLQQYRDELACLKFPVQLLDKDFPNVLDESFERRFIQPIAALFEEGITYTVEHSSKYTPSIEGVDPFRIEFSDFMALPIVEKDMLADKAQAMARRTLDNAFSRGKVWVLLCGDRNEVATSAEDMNGIPTEEEVLKYAQRRNRAPFQFGQALQTEEYWTFCSSSLSSQNYPTISLLFENEEMELHFDTGCPFSLFSYEELVGNGILQPVSQFIKETRVGFPSYRCAVLRDIVVLVKSQKSGQTQRVRLNGKAIREWLSTSYARTCKDSCPQEQGHVPGELCPLRRGLIGRNILTDNAIALTLDGAAKRTYFSGE